MNCSKGESEGRPTGFLRDSETVRMLRALDFDVIDMVSIFIESIVYRFRELDYGSVTEVSPFYVHAINLIQRRGRTPEWVKNEGQLL